jgi:hypothetical protein
VSQSFTVSAVVAGAPTIGTATAGNTQATVNWAAPASNGGAAITGYQVQVATSSGGSYSNAAGTCAPASTNATTAVTCTATGLTNGTQYFFKVAAINSAGTGSYSSASSGVTPVAPVTYTVTYNGNTNTGGTAPTDASSPYTPGSTVTVLGNTGTLVKTGYSFNNWNTATNGSGTSYAPTATFAVAADTTLYAQWTLIPAPTVTSISPTSGPTAGGTSVTITGTNFTGATAVTIGGAAATGVTVVSATSITATTPAGTAGARDVVVTTAGGSGTGSGLYTYVAAPTATTGSASGIGATGATLNGTLSSNGAATTVTFDYGTTNSYGSTATATQSPLAADASGSAASVAITGLSCNTSYHFRVKGVNSVATTNGSDATFTTSACVPGAPTIGTATAGNAQASITFTAPGSNGGGAITTYTATSNPGSLTGTCAGPAACTITVTGLTNGTAYTFTVTATNSVGTGSASAASNSVTPKASQTITFGTAPTVVAGGTGTVITTGGGSNIARVYASTTLAACTVDSSTGVVTGVTAGTANCTITANQGGNSNYNAAAQVSQSFSIGAAEVAVLPFIPPLTSLPVVPAVGNSLLTVLNLSEGAGPALTGCLRDTLSSILGADWLYQGQSADGGARLGHASQVISYYAIDASSRTSYGLGQGSGIYLRGANPLDVVTACGTFVTTPAMYNLGEFGSLLNAAGLTVQLNAQGVMTVQVGALIYVARPDYLVTQGAPGAPGLTTGTDGLMRFTDSAGHIQILYPALLDPEVLGNQVALAVSGYLVIQTDGTALVTLLSGEKFVLTPDLTLGTVPPEFFAVGWWQDGPNHYRYRNSSFSNTSQGFTVTPR